MITRRVPSKGFRSVSYISSSLPTLSWRKDTPTLTEIKGGKLELAGLTVAIAEGVDRKDVLLEVDASGDAEAGFVIRAKDHKNYLLANYAPAMGGVYFHEVVNGAWGPALDRVAVKNLSRDIHLTAKVEGTRVTFSLSDGTTRFTTTHQIKRYTEAGRFGLFHNKTPRQRFDNFRIAGLGGRKILADSFDRPDGSARGWDAGHEDGYYEFGHFHHGLYALMAVCEYGVAANNREVLRRVDACYRWAREFGDPLVGFYPESMSWDYPTTEICEVADMVFLALNLTRAGLGDYWEDVDRWVRNMYAEGQLCDTASLEKIPDGYFNDAPAGHVYQDTQNIRERSVGSFWGWMRPNEGLRVDLRDGQPKLASHSIMHCCTANGARTLYYVWDSILTKQDDLVRVNLLLNRASPWLDVDSYLPAEGKVVLHIKSTGGTPSVCTAGREEKLT